MVLPYPVVTSLFFPDFSAAFVTTDHSPPETFYLGVCDITPAWFFSSHSPCFLVPFAGSSSTVSPQKFEVSHGLFLGTFLIVLHATPEKDTWYLPLFTLPLSINHRALFLAGHVVSS